MGSLPYNLRVNVAVPFPSLVAGAAGIKVVKTNGIWTIQTDFTAFAQLVPIPANFGVTWFEVWNSTTGVYNIVSLSSLAAAAGQTINATIVTPLQSPYTPLATDTVLYVGTTSGPVEIALAPVSSRNGISLVIKDINGNANVNNITIRPFGAETIDGYTNAAPLPINSNYGGFMLYPAPTLSKYTIAP